MSVIRLLPFYEMAHLYAVCEQLPCWLMKSVAESCYWKGNSFLAHWEITNILWNLKVLYHVRNSPFCITLETAHYLYVLWSRWIQSMRYIIFKIYCNIVLPSLSKSSKWSFSFRFSHHNPLYFSSSTLFLVQVTSLTHVILRELIMQVILVSNTKLKLLILQWSPFFCYCLCVRPNCLP